MKLMQKIIFTQDTQNNALHHVGLGVNMNEAGREVEQLSVSGNWPESLPRSLVHQSDDNVAKKSQPFHERGNIMFHCVSAFPVSAFDKSR